MNSFINRTISGVLMLIVSFICIYCGGYALIGYAMTIAVLCLIELFRTFKLNDLLVIVLSMLFSVAILYSIGSSNKDLVLTFFHYIFFLFPYIICFLIKSILKILESYCFLLFIFQYLWEFF